MSRQKSSEISGLIVSLALLFFFAPVASASSKPSGTIGGHIELDESWERVIYLSLIPTFDKMHTMSSSLIVAKAPIDGFGNYLFDIGFLPDDDKLFRLHAVKKGDVPNSLIIGGSDHNHLFLILNGQSKIEINSTQKSPPFESTTFSTSRQNIVFQKVTNMITRSQNEASESSQSKREFLEFKLDQELLHVADTCSDVLTSLYALYQRKQELSTESEFFDRFSEKWRHQKSPYWTSFRSQYKLQSKGLGVFGFVAGGLVLIGLGFVLGQKRTKPKTRVRSLSPQERKILKMLQNGASNQEIADEYSIEVSTVKSHVRSIFGKMKVKSRKDLLREG